MRKRVVLVVLTCLLFLSVCWVYMFSYVVVSGDSMLPTLKTGDFLVINHGNKVQKGDIIVFSLSSKHKELVKRVIAEAGDTVEITASAIKVNGEAIKEDYIKNNKSYSYDLMSATTVPANCIFVLGDNRAVSVDSRSDEVGMVNLNQVDGVLVWNVSNTFGKSAEELSSYIVDVTIVLFLFASCCIIGYNVVGFIASRIKSHRGV